MKRGNKPAFAAKQKRQAKRVGESERDVSHSQDDHDQMDDSNIGHANKQQDGKKRSQFGSKTPAHTSDH